MHSNALVSLVYQGFTEALLMSNSGFLKILVAFQPATPLAVREAGSEQWSELLCRDTVNDSPEVAIARYVLNMVQISRIVLNGWLLSLVVTAEQRWMLQMKNSQGVHDDIDKGDDTRSATL